jgi:hypothetical protein
MTYARKLHLLTDARDLLGDLSCPQWALHEIFEDEFGVSVYRIGPKDISSEEDSICYAYDCQGYGDGDARFIAGAPKLVQDLLDELVKAWAQLDSTGSFT